MPERQTTGLFVPTTNVWDPSEIYATEVTSPEFKELMVRLYQNLNLISTSLNLKDTGYYDIFELATGAGWFPSADAQGQKAQSLRGEYRFAVDFGALPNATTKVVAHNVTLDLGCVAVEIWGAATNPTTGDMVPIPYVSNTPNNNIELRNDLTNVYITTAADWSAYTKTVVVIEYLRF